MRAFFTVISCTIALGCSGGAPVEVGPESLRGAGDPTLVHTSGGLARGVIEGSTRVFRGLPFAAPPVGDLRWRLPQPPPPWSGIRDASTFQSLCAQIDARGDHVGSDDCLYLNVYTPAENLQRGPLPILVWVHGGGNVRGTGQTEAHALAGAGAIVVTLEYRVNIFGWLALPAAADAEFSTGNYGLFDVLAALEWVQRNAGALGGDPRRVLLFGQSAGGFDVSALATANIGPGWLFTRAAAQSGGVSVGDLIDAKSAAAEGSAVATALGCSGTAAQQLACLRARPTMDLVDGYYAQIGAHGQAFGPTLDGLLLGSDPATVLHRDGARVPLLIGSTRDEWSFTHDPSEALDAAQFASAVANAFPAQAGQILPLYPLADYLSPLRAFIDVQSDAYMTCPVANDARFAVANPHAQPVYRYLFTHTMENDPDLAALGATHTLELPFLFGFGHPVYFVGRDYQPTAAEQALSATLQGYWIRFARTGNPNGAGVPAWPRWDARARLQYLDDTVTSGDDYHAAQCALLAPYPF